MDLIPLLQNLSTLLPPQLLHSILPSSPCCASLLLRLPSNTRYLTLFLPFLPLLWNRTEPGHSWIISSYKFGTVYMYNSCLFTTGIWNHPRPFAQLLHQSQICMFNTILWLSAPNLGATGQSMDLGMPLFSFRSYSNLCIVTISLYIFSASILKAQAWWLGCTFSSGW